MNPDVRRLTLAVYLPSVIFSFCDGLLVPTLPLFAASFDVALWVVGLALAGEAIGMLVADAPVGWLLRRLPQKSAMLLGGGLTALAVLATAVAPNLAVVVALRVLAGVGLALFGIARHAYLAHATRGQGRGRVIAVFGGVTRLGLFVRSVTQNRPMASCMGVNTARVDTLAFSLGAGVAGLAVDAGAEPVVGKVEELGEALAVAGWRGRKIVGHRSLLTQDR